MGKEGVKCNAVQWRVERGGARGEEQPAGSGKDRIDCSIPRSGEGSKEGRLVEERRCGMLGEEVLVLACACLCLCLPVLVLACACACACACAWRFGFWRFNGGPRTLTRLTHSLTLLNLDVRRAMKRDLAWGRYG
jgi:hypothetical protein